MVNYGTCFKCKRKLTYEEVISYDTKPWDGVTVLDVKCLKSDDGNFKNVCYIQLCPKCMVKLSDWLCE